MKSKNRKMINCDDPLGYVYAALFILPLIVANIGVVSTLIEGVFLNVPLSSEIKSSVIICFIIDFVIVGSFFSFSKIMRMQAEIEKEENDKKIQRQRVKNRADNRLKKSKLAIPSTYVMLSRRLYLLLLQKFA